MQAIGQIYEVTQRQKHTVMSYNTQTLAIFFKNVISLKKKKKKKKKKKNDIF